MSSINLTKNQHTIEIVVRYLDYGLGRIVVASALAIVCGCASTPPQEHPYSKMTDAQLFAEIHDSIERVNDRMDLRSPGTRTHITKLDGSGFTLDQTSRFGPDKKRESTSVRVGWPGFDHFTLGHDSSQFALFLLAKSPMQYQITDEKGHKRFSSSPLIMFSFEKKQDALDFRDLLVAAASRHGGASSYPTAL